MRSLTPGLIEDVTAIPKLYSKLQASRELRAMLNIGRPERQSDVTRLSDACGATEARGVTVRKKHVVRTVARRRMRSTGHFLAVVCTAPAIEKRTV
jgi:hypothetical protein